MRTKTIVAVLVTVLFLLARAVAHAQDGKEFSALGGVIWRGNENSRTFELEYSQMMQNLRPFGFSVAYLNEGHFEGANNDDKHHRDGFTAQVWAKTTILNQRFTLGAGVGPYLYFDTVKANKTMDADRHGFAGIMSADATHAITDQWDIHLRTNYIKTPGSADTFAILGGLGYRFDSPSKISILSEANSGKNEVTISLGETVVNNIDTKHPLAKNIEYRRALWKHIDWTVSYLDEGKSGLIDRRGGVAELWAMQRFFGGRMDMGIGAGAYAAFDSMRDRTFGLNGIITMTVGYRVYDHWGLRSEWHRVVTDHDRDSDVILGGIGYRF
ncbi:MAG: hypothetical protein Q8N61_00275 [bacterium]|nr:hypothetical protein [bacterium]